MPTGRKDEIVASGRDHPEPQRLERFLRGELARPERRIVVRHLLTGCRGASE